MKITIQDIAQGEEESAVFHIRCLSENITRAINILKSPESLTVYLDDQAYLLPAGEVFYAESVDLKTFVYAERTVYRSKLKLYELEELLNPHDFLRISKQIIVNVRKIKNVAPAGSSRFLATLTNSERVIISRQYVPALKERFGL